MVARRPDRTKCILGLARHDFIHGQTGRTGRLARRQEGVVADGGVPVQAAQGPAGSSQAADDGP